ncbi:MAG: MFS transporter [Planctomycetes bacterium]|nr:MFS transporter [Planctomycetota bacterium]
MIAITPLPSERATHARYLVLALLCAAACAAYLCRNSLGVVVADGRLLRDLGITKTQAGWAMSAFYWSYAVFQLPGGWAGHRWGSRAVLPLFALCWAAATAAVGLAQGLVLLLAAQLINGAGQAGLFPNAAQSLASWFPVRRRALACGLLAAFMSIGGALALTLTGGLLTVTSWRWIFVLLALPSLVWALWFAWWFRNRPQEHAAVNDGELALLARDKALADESATANSSQEDGSVDLNPHYPANEPPPLPWMRLVRSRSLWLICGQQFFRAAGYIFYATWFPTFLKETRGIETAKLGFLASLPLLAVVAGSSIGGVLIDWVHARTGQRRWSRHAVAVVSMLCCGALIAAAYAAESAAMAIGLITAGSFCSAVAGPCSYAVTIDKSGPYIPLIFAVMNMSGNVGAAVCPIAVERLVVLAGDWNAALILFSGIYAGAALCWALLPPAGTIPDEAGPS